MGAASARQYARARGIFRLTSADLARALPGLTECSGHERRAQLVAVALERGVLVG